MEKLFKEEIEEENKWNKAGEGIAMGLMGLGDALGGAWGGKTDYLGSYLKMKQAAKKPKFTAYQALQLKRQKELDNRTAKLDKEKRENLADTIKRKKEADLKKEADRIDAHILKVDLKNAESQWQKGTKLIKLSPYMQQFKDNAHTGSTLEQLKRLRAKPPLSPTQQTKPPLQKRSIVSPTQTKPLIKEKPEPPKPQPIFKKETEMVEEKIIKEPKKEEIKVFTSEMFKNNRMPQTDFLSAKVSNAIGRKFTINSEQDLKMAQRYEANANKARANSERKLGELRRGGDFNTTFLGIRSGINKALYDSIFSQVGGIPSDFDYSKNIKIVGDDIFYVDKNKDGTEAYRQKIKLPGFFGFVSAKVPDKLRIDYINAQRAMGKLPIGADQFEQSWAKLKGIQLNDLSGAAVSEEEFKRFKESFENAGRDPAAILRSIMDMESQVKTKLNRSWDAALRAVKSDDKGFYNELKNHKNRPVNMFTGYGSKPNADYYQNIDDILMVMGKKGLGETFEVYVPKNKKIKYITREQLRNQLAKIPLEERAGWLDDLIRQTHKFKRSQKK